MASFAGDTFDQRVEIPGQYERVVNKPIPEYHPTIAGFSDEVCKNLSTIVQVELYCVVLFDVTVSRL